MPAILMVICLSLHSHTTWAADGKQVNGSRKGKTPGQPSASLSRNQRSILDNRVDTFHPLPHGTDHHFSSVQQPDSYYPPSLHRDRHAYPPSHHTSPHAYQPSYGGPAPIASTGPAHPLNSESLLAALLSSDNSELTSDAEHSPDPWASDFLSGNDLSSPLDQRVPFDLTSDFFGSKNGRELELDLPDIGAHNSRARASESHNSLDRSSSSHADSLSPAHVDSSPASSGEDAAFQPLDPFFLSQLLEEEEEGDAGNMAATDDLDFLAGDPLLDVDLDLSSALTSEMQQEGDDIMAEFLEFLELKESGALAQCLDHSSVRRRRS